MRCIFCKHDSTDSRSIEHIIPESIGNEHHFLPKGIVCDKCNNYFSRSFENAVITSDIFLEIRNGMKVKSKKGKIPETPQKDFIELPDYRLMGRFLGKIGLEVLAQTALKNNVQSWEIDIIDNIGLDQLRKFVRDNSFKGDWPFSFRTLYPINAVFDDGVEKYEVLHEYDLLYTEGNELYIVVCLFGVEFSMNMGGPELEGYRLWLERNDFKSPLYSGKKFKK